MARRIAAKSSQIKYCAPYRAGFGPFERFKISFLPSKKSLFLGNLLHNLCFFAAMLLTMRKNCKCYLDGKNQKHP
jgi:hypothetical protein